MASTIPEMNSRNATKSARDMYELKKKALTYYQENGVPQKMEAILNAMFHDDPCDPYGHVANFFEQFAKTPTVTKILAREVLDSKGQPTLQAEIHCMVKNFEKLIATSSMSSVNNVLENAKIEEKDIEDEERQAFVTAALTFIEKEISAILVDKDPTHQREIDAEISDIFEKLRQEEEERQAQLKEQEAEADVQEVETASVKKGGKSAKGRRRSMASAVSTSTAVVRGKKGTPVVIIPDEPKEQIVPGCNAACVTSQVVCKAGAVLQSMPLYEYIARIKLEQVPSEMCIPQPMVPILFSGKAAPGKLNCVKEFMIIPRHDMPYCEALSKISKVYNQMMKTLFMKSGPKATNKVVIKNGTDTGALCPQLDRPEQGLDMLLEVLTLCGFTAGEEFNIALNCAAHEMFDYDKGKYEVISGQMKSGEEMADFWADIVTRYPAVVALIDPVRNVEKESWIRVCDRVTETCYVMGDVAWKRPGLLKDEPLTDAFQTNGVVMHWDHLTTLTDLVDCATKMEGANNQIVISTNIADTEDTILADLAVGVGARFIKIGAPCRGERVAKYNRLLQIESHLKYQGKLGTWPGYEIPRIQLPPPPAEQEEETVPAEADGQKKK